MKNHILSISILQILLIALWVQPVVVGEEPLKAKVGIEALEFLPLECRIRAVYKGEGDVLKLKISLENVGEPPLRVMLPNCWYNMSAATMIGGWEFKFLGPDGKPAELDWGGPPPSPKALFPTQDQTPCCVMEPLLG